MFPCVHPSIQNSFRVGTHSQTSYKKKCTHSARNSYKGTWSSKNFAILVLANTNGTLEAKAKDIPL